MFPLHNWLEIFYKYNFTFKTSRDINCSYLTKLQGVEFQ